LWSPTPNLNISTSSTGLSETSLDLLSIPAIVEIGQLLCPLRLSEIDLNVEE
jgi:hypothetical protein